MPLVVVHESFMRSETPLIVVHESFRRCEMPLVVAQMESVKSKRLQMNAAGGVGELIGGFKSYPVEKVFEKI